MNKKQGWERYCEMGKRAYGMKSIANKAANKFNSKHKELGDNKKQFPYLCACGQWHLTTIHPKEWRKRKQKQNE